MSNILKYFVLLILLNNCSLDTKSGIWTNKKKIIVEKDNTTKVFVNKKKLNREFNPNLEIKLSSKLISNSSIKHLKKLLLPLCTMVTPNIPEAEILTGYSISNKEDMIKAAKKILNMGSKNVLLKSGHLKNKMIFDVLATKKGIKIF